MLFQKFDNLMERRNALMDAMGLTSGSGGAPEEKDEDKEESQNPITLFSRMDLSALNAHYAAQTMSIRQDSLSPTDQQPDESWCTKQLKAELEATLPADALPSSVLSQDTYQSLRHQQQQSAIPDPHLQVSTRKTATTSASSSTTSEFGHAIGSGGIVDMSTSGQAFQNSGCGSSSSGSNSALHQHTQQSAPRTGSGGGGGGGVMVSSTSGAGPLSAADYLRSLPDLSYMLTAPLS